MNRPLPVVCASLLASPLLFAGAAAHAAPAPPAAPSAPADGIPVVEAEDRTPPVYDDEEGGEADADDPAVWVHPDDGDESLVIGTLKNAGLDVYDLDGDLVQHIDAPAAEGARPAGRFNNVDIVRGFPVGGSATDLAVVSDRGQDRVRLFAIDADAVEDGRPPLREVTDPAVPTVFSADDAGAADERTAYGLTAFTDGGESYAVVSRADETTLALLRLTEESGGGVGYEHVDTLDLPSSFALSDGAEWAPCTDPDERPHVEGMVADVSAGALYAGQEAVGLWRIGLTGEGFGDAEQVDRVRSYGVPWTYDADRDEECVLDWNADPGEGGDVLTADVEGVTLQPDGDGKGHVIASSQGDDTFALYDREDGAHAGSFSVEGVEHTDGLDVVSRPVGDDYDEGILVVQDGEAEPAPGRGDATGFAYVEWEDVAEDVLDD
ncbi:phytase [Nocardiopsis sp. RSe5-2]|uniref:Phytase n=1 Tax=Nocardiopsis endophytica TaxID=3018445 RepID=A0ABT4UAA3_9ACTN|nr:phytase [Nocardiopsis endophytica]MDA2813888.1 phytase [Nocardiopsis endophytica]